MLPTPRMMVAAMAMVTTLTLAACAAPQAAPTAAPTATAIAPAPAVAPAEVGRPLFIDFYAPW